MGHFVAAFVAPKLDILNNNPGEFPAEFVATKADILEETSGEVAAVFVVTKAGILSKTWSFPYPIAKCFLVPWPKQISSPAVSQQRFQRIKCNAWT